MRGIAGVGARRQRRTPRQATPSIFRVRDRVSRSKDVTKRRCRRLFHASYNRLVGREGSHANRSSVQRVAALRRRLADNRIDFYHCVLVLDAGRDPASIGLDHRCNRSRALALRDRIVGSAKAAWPISRCRSRATAARRHARRRLRPTRRSHGARQMGLTWRAHQSRSMDAKFGPELRCRCLSRSHDRRDVGSLLAR